MTFWYIFALSLVQGITEFLPISSSGHLVLLPKLMGEADQGLLMDVALHVGTLMAIVVYYWKDLWRMLLAVLTWKTTTDIQSRNLAIYIVLATIPALLMGVVIHVLFPEGIRDVRVITATTLFFGLLMGIADMKGRQEETVETVTLKKALMIGCAQALALIPGTSRSGVTMTTARFLGFKRVDAARFSFLLGIPATAAAGAMGVLDIVKSGDAGLVTHAASAVVMSFLAGILSIHFLMKWLTRYGLLPFVIYRILLGICLLVFVV